MNLLPSHRDRLPSTSRYELLVKIASGGMGTVYVGRLLGAASFRRLVAIKRAHAHLLEDPQLRQMLITEARLASGMHHPNVVAVQDVEELDDELLLVMDYVEGVAMSELLGAPTPRQTPLPARLTVRIVLDACAGLQAVHDLIGEDGRRLGLVHRDVSPQNILVGVDGIVRLSDFGIAKPTGHTASSGATSTGVIKGKVAYMAPEYLEGGVVSPKVDVYALGVVTWEALTHRRLFRGTTDFDTIQQVLKQRIPLPSSVAPGVSPLFDDVLMGALARDPAERFETARAFALALEEAARRADSLGVHTEVAAHVKLIAGDLLERRRALLREPSDPGGIDVRTPSSGRALETSSHLDVHAIARPRDEATKSIPKGTAVDPIAATSADSDLTQLDTPSATITTSRQRRSAWLAGAAAGLAVFGCVAYAAMHRSQSLEVGPAAAAPPSVETPPSSAPPANSAIAVAPDEIASGAPARPPDAAPASSPAPARPNAPSNRGSSRPAPPAWKRPSQGAGAAPKPSPSPADTGLRAPPNPYRGEATSK